MASQDLSRRILPAILVALVSSAALGALVVAADEGSAAPPMPAWFGVAEPRVGDGWRYNLTLAGDWAFAPGDSFNASHATPFGELRWAEPGVVRGADGLMHDANHLLAKTLTYSPEAITVRGPGSGSSYDDGEVSTHWDETETGGWVLAGSLSYVERGESIAGNHTFTNYGVVAGVGASATRTSYTYGFTDYRAASPCLATNALQGANTTVAAPLHLFGPCLLAGNELGLPDLAFRAAGIDTIGGVESLRYEAKENGSFTAWFTPGIPYPVRLAADLPAQPPVKPEDGMQAPPADAASGDAGPLGARSFTFDLVGFKAGDRPLDGIDALKDRHAAPALVLADRKPWGMDETGLADAGIDHPFPLSVAFNGAKNSTQFADLRTYLNTHPQAYVNAAGYEERTGGSGLERAWGIGMTDGDESFRFSAIQSTPDHLLPVALRGKAPSVVTYQRGGYVPMPGGQDLPPSVLPSQFPTVASVAARWAAFDGSKTPFNMWGWSVHCPDPADTCDHAAVDFFAGNVQRDYNYFPPPGMPAIPGNPYGNETYAMVERVLTMDAAGQGVEMLQLDHRSDTTDPGSGPLGPAPPGSGDPGFHVASTAIQGVPATSWLPPPEQAASVGFMGIVLGALYLIWPKAKALALLGLFSRMERGQVLEHPARQLLVQLVEARPGIHYHDLARAADLANGTASHHLRKLTEAGHLNVRRSGRYTCYFPGGRLDAAEAAAAPLLKSPGARQVLATVRARPGLSNLELAQATGLQPSTVNYHAQRLATAGLVEGLRDGRHVRFHPGIRTGLAAS